MAKKHYFMGSRGAPRGVDPDKPGHSEIEGVAKTGQISDSGTVRHDEYLDGRMDATVSPQPVSAILSVETPGEA